MEIFDNGSYLNGSFIPQEKNIKVSDTLVINTVDLACQYN